MELNAFFKSYVETEIEPVVICDLDYRIIYINKASAEKNEKYGGYDVVGKSLRTFLDVEAQSKVDMVVEWFKEDRNNSRVFAIRLSSASTDFYIAALRDDNGELIGFCNKCCCRIPDDTEPYTIC